ncbi:hypothetical protein PGT21_029328 [Puccinia graminis f. sp. tritici]|uniref:Uncharacterized protein n=1 Tax=Puccinia graminis f. sp. tritici TaxID=56615 RepID=A0A5B0P3W9_PUCGR|nr:hypothetical protein PGT21_003693 [Puccinia graminis f. sp. tritici]KAA1094759.1 hypothetical protein PGT21_029328 [Puccinia graminis f. sp. tritici]
MIGWYQGVPRGPDLDDGGLFGSFWKLISTHLVFQFLQFAFLQGFAQGISRNFANSGTGLLSSQMALSGEQFSSIKAQYVFQGWFIVQDQGAWFQI